MSEFRGSWPHPLVRAWREVFGRRHPNHRDRPRSRRRDLRHACIHLGVWMRDLRRAVTR